ncbi:MAG: hypothetical protein AB8B73_12525 [Ekhidna sp.]
MIFTIKQARSKIERGELKTLTEWTVSEKEMTPYNKQQSRENFRSALVGALVLPGIFILLAIGNMIFYQDVEFLLMMIKFSIFFFILLYPFSYWGQWRKSRSFRKGKEALFGENWFLFGKIFQRWKGLTSFKGCQIDYTRNPKVITISTQGSGRGQIEQSFMIPIPEEKLNVAEKLAEFYREKH